MKQPKDLNRFQPNPQFLIDLEKNLVLQNNRKVIHSYWSLFTLAASFALLVWMFPSKVENSINESIENPELVFLQEHFEDSEENLEVLSANLSLETEGSILEDELIEELKTMY